MKFFKEGELKLLWPFYLFELISPMFFFIPAFVVVYFRGLGFSLFEIGLIVMMMPLFRLFFEIPTGAIADIYGRKFSVILGNMIGSLAIFSVFFLDNYYAILFAFAMIGFGDTFLTGAREAWVVDLVKYKKKDFLHRFLAKKNSFQGVGVLVSGFLGAFLVKTFGISIIWFIGGLSIFTVSFILFFAEEHFVKRKIKIKNTFKDVNNQTIKSVNYIQKNKILFLFLIASSITVFAGVFGADLAWITFFQDFGFPDYAFGYMWSAMGLVMIIAPLTSLKLLKKGKERQFILISIILGILIVLPLIFISSIIIGLSIMLMYLFFAAMTHPAERLFFNKFVPSKLRATIGSVEGMLISIIGVVSIPLAGLSVDLLGAEITILLSGLIMIPAAVIYLFIKEK